MTLPACSRRSFGRLMLGGIVCHPRLLRAAASGRVDVGLHSYSLRSIPHEGAVETIFAAMRELGLKHLELWEHQVAPVSTTAPSAGGAPEQMAVQRRAAEALTNWRLTVAPESFLQMRRRFQAAGIIVRGYNVGLGNTPEEIDRQFAMAEALGAEALCARMPEQMTETVASLAGKHRMIFGIQSVDPDALSQQMPQSKFFRIDLDIGDFTRAGHDALAFVKQNYAKIADIHLKDCLLNGPSVPFGTGDSHMAEILQFVAANRPSIQTYIDCDYPGTGQSVEEIRRCYAFVQTALRQR